jgi:phenylalanyl-tRNA synthetase alpha chain
MEIKINTNEEEVLLENLENRSDSEAVRIRRYLNMADLSRTDGSPIKELVEKVQNTELLKDFDVIKVPEVVSTDVAFDLFEFPKDHPARSKSDTYYVDDSHVLRTHTTVMWYYYLQQEVIKKKIEEGLDVGAISYGKVYRKDEIDRNHMNIFHQIDGWYLTPRTKKIVTMDDLKEVLIKIVQTLFGQDVKYQFIEETFPFTDPSIEVEVEINGKWVEVVGSGVVKGAVLKNLGVDPELYNGWAFGFGLERLAIIGMELPDIRLLWSDDERVKKQLKLGNIFKEVSKYPAIVRDISFLVDKANFAPNDYFDVVRDVVGDMAEEMALVDEYENEAKFGVGKKSYAYRITYRALDRTLTDTEVNEIHKKLEEETTKVFGATVR